MKKLLTILLSCALLLCTASAALAEGDAHLTIAYQYGLAYAPAVVAQTENMIEKAYADATGGALTGRGSGSSTKSESSTAA